MDGHRRAHDIEALHLHDIGRKSIRNVRAALPAALRGAGVLRPADDDQPFLWRAIYVLALVATRRNPGPKAKYDQLIRPGKSGKVALTAVMRKLIVMANALLRDVQKCSELRPRP